MKINTKTLITLFFIFYTYYTSVSWAFNPVTVPSTINKCSYRINGYKIDWSSYDTNWLWNNLATCDNTINFSSNPHNVEDWVYNLYFRADDNTIIPASNKLNTWNDSVIQGTYKIDTKPVECVVNTFTMYWIDNQYYNNGNLYYKSIWGSWKFSMDITCNDQSNTNIGKKCFSESCVSGIKKFTYPTLLWDNPVVSNTESSINEWTLEKKKFTLTYVWSWNNNQTIDLLTNITNFAEDYAWNITTLKKAINTKLVVRDKNDTTTIQEIDNINNLVLNPDSIGPSLLDIQYKSWNNWELIYESTRNIDWTSKYMSALENRIIKIPDITDNGSWIRWFELFIEKYDDKSSYLNRIVNWSTLNNWRLININSSSFYHDFRDVSNNWDYNNNWYRAYSWYIQTIKQTWTETTDEICDMVDNCVTMPTPDFKIVSNQPLLANSIHTFQDKFTWRISNYKDKYQFDILFKDKYGNEVVPVTWVKNITITNNLDNTLWTDQISNPNSGDWVLFSFFDWNDDIISFNNNYHNYSKNFTQKSDLDKWQLKIEVKSAVPTKNEYLTASDNPWEVNKSLYWDLSAVLKYNKFQIDVDTNNWLWYNWIWEYTPTSNSFVSLLPEFTFKPIINFNFIWNIYPLVEWQVKNMTIKNEVLDTLELDKFNLDLYVWTNNSFLKFDDAKFLNWYISKSNWDSINKYNYHIVKWTQTSSQFNLANSNISNNSSDTFQILPKTIWWITNNNTNVWLYSILNYTTNTKNVKLPSIQTWFKDFWVHNKSHFTINSQYLDISKITFAEIQITWISQTNNKWLNKNTDWSIVTDTAKTSFNDISKISLYDLKTNIKSNLSKYLKWNILSKASVWNVNDTITLNNLNIFDNLKGLLLKWWDIIYIKNRNVVIDCWVNWCWISGKKTIIVENWNLTIKSDMFYSNNNSILWIVIIWKNSDWYNWQLKIDEKITNWVWIVYSEWPIVSVNSLWQKYDWTNVWTNLKNQLYWKWSFATKNTVWWAINFDSKTSCPFGTPEYENSCTTEIAQWYDLIYLRRYAVEKSWTNILPINWPVLIAWWITFKSNWDKEWWNINLINSTNITSPLIIDYDPKLQSTPPYLFEKQ